MLLLEGIRERDRERGNEHEETNGRRPVVVAGRDHPDHVESGPGQRHHSDTCECPAPECPVTSVAVFEGADPVPVPCGGPAGIAGDADPEHRGPEEGERAGHVALKRSDDGTDQYGACDEGVGR
ncbi:hypothetical protein [Cryobacterium sp. MDB2-33-2]|uniref:hypothetical protein n=1 Tax=Cryobacterium sp. MDB2-33-2 TaxID=1259179 RepID=UPI00106AD879|nr:hypothetical protein [Cryobacterium sp. MDB2-33-2]TFC11584.1 hypothetical protein E3O59_01130 [Cryobacterium sp. MDB2-33-2]